MYQTTLACLLVTSTTLQEQLPLARTKLTTSANFVGNFHPCLKFTLGNSNSQLPFLDLYLNSTSQGLATTIHNKETDSHLYLTYSFSHPVQCKNSFPCSQLLCHERICSDDNNYHSKNRINMHTCTKQFSEPSVVLL